MKSRKSLEHNYVSPKQKERESLGLPPIKIAWGQGLERREAAPPPPPDDWLVRMLGERSSSDDSLDYSI